MLKKLLVIIILAIILGIFLYLQPFIFSKTPNARIIDRLPDADFIGRVNILDLTKETTDLLYFYKTPFRDLTSADYILGQGKTFGLDLQKPVYLFFNKDGEWGAMILINDAEKAKQGIEKLKQNIGIKDLSTNKTFLYFIPKLNLHLHFSNNYLLVYSGKKIKTIISHVKNAKYKGISNLWQDFFSKSTFKNETTVIFSKWQELKKYDIDYVMLAHDSDSSNVKIKCYFHKLKNESFSAKENGLSFSNYELPKRSFELHLNPEKFRASKDNPLKNLLIAKGKKISFPTASFIESWGGIISFFEGGAQEIKERYIASDIDENFNLTQKVKYRTVSVPGYSLLFNTNEKGPEFIEKLFSKGILSKDGKKYRVLFSPPLNMTKKDNYYLFYSGERIPKVTESSKNEAYFPINGTNYFFKLDSINSVEIAGTIDFSAKKMVKELIRKSRVK